jgi:hypothetical protein
MSKVNAGTATGSNPPFFSNFSPTNAVLAAGPLILGENDAISTLARSGIRQNSGPEGCSPEVWRLPLRI